MTRQEIAVGQQLEPVTIVIDRARLVRYAGASGDRNPIHWDEAFAKDVGLPDVIAHGMFTMGAAAEVVGRWVGDPGRIVAYATKFSAPVPVPREGGATVEVSGVVTKLDESAGSAVIELTATHQGTKVLTRALVTLRLG